MIDQLEQLIEALEGKFEAEYLEVEGRDKVKYVTVHPAEPARCSDNLERPLLRAVANKLTDNGSVSDLVLDLGELQTIGQGYLEPINIQMLIHIYTQFKDTEHALKLVVPEGTRVDAKLKQFQIDQNIEVYRSKQEVLESYK